MSQLDVEHRTVIVRCDLNVPLDASGEVVAIADDGRIRASIPTLTALRNRGAKVVV
ncbi:MAG: phosphoglycerate kinase, partial [Candidatus Nanopelagicales bacterium]